MGIFLRILESNCERESAHFVAVDPRDIIKECSNCGAEMDKPLWVWDYLCLSCGFEANRDANAAYNNLSRGLDHVGVVHSESISVESAPPVDTSISTKRAMEVGSPASRNKLRWPRFISQ